MHQNKGPSKLYCLTAWDLLEFSLKRGKGEGGRFSGLGLIFSSEYDQSFFSQLMVCQESNVPMKQAASIMPLTGAMRKMGKCEKCPPSPFLSRCVLRGRCCKDA
ncbi:hypothetical protein CA13_58790 [Planctomycetes bacterium CA13]|uniref:Uncharacterized protein n=1 Tax=Novipirellula herctigrandis TaxID=2527986 RepID=A0A5C5ZC52_9BACT|nr:hypothetical protein CA13_58790 [Planctomycetes bacterium CA13]